MRATYVFAAISLAFLSATARAQQYTMQVLGPADTEPNLAFAINASGQVVGTGTSNNGGPSPYAVVWSNDGSVTKLADLSPGNTTLSRASAINTAGQIVGIADVYSPITNSATQYPVVWNGNSVEALGPSGTPRAINSAGVSVGDDGNGGAALWSSGASQVIGGFGTTAYGINDKGIIVGQAAAGSNSSAERWDPTSNGLVESSFPSLGGLTGAYAINNLGQAVGESAGQPVLWNGTKIVTLPTLAGGTGVALAISDTGQIAGMSLADTGLLGEDAVTWINGELIDLNTAVVNPDPNIHLYRAVGVNSKGQIVVVGQAGGGQTNFALLLTPTGIAPPSILWQNSNGDVVRWFVNNGTIGSSADLGVVPSSWKVQGMGDFAGIGNEDILWRNSTGDVVIWFVQAGTITSSADLGVIPAGWTVAGTGDFNADGKTDILWRNSNGDVVIWFMNGGTIASSADLGVIPGNWTIESTGDFNSDGKADVLWRNTTTGDVVVWFMDAGTISSSADLGVVPSSWMIQGTGVDGQPDILWRNSNGDVVIWFINGGAIASSSDLGVVPSSWTIQGTGDFNSDGQTDIVWRNSNGDVVIWFMNGGTIASSADLGVVPTSWTIQP